MLPHIALLAAGAAAAAPVPVEVAVDTGSASAAFDHKWKRSFGSGHSSLTLRPDWRAQLAQAAQQLGLQGVRYHGLFDDDMGPVVSVGPAGDLVYNWTLVDSTWDYMKSVGVCVPSPPPPTHTQRPARQSRQRLTAADK